VTRVVSRKVGDQFFPELLVSLCCHYYKKLDAVPGIKYCLAIFWLGFREFPFHLVGSVTRMILK
jgi:hypothetical protein